MLKYKIVLLFYISILHFTAVNSFSQTIDENGVKIQEERKYRTDNLDLPLNIAENGVVDSVIYKTIDRYNDLRTHKETYTLNNDSKLYFTFDEIWDPDSNKWINYSTDSLAFDENGNIVLKLGKLWNGEEWENWSKSEYNFDDGLKKSWQYYNWLSFSGWSKGVKETYFYDEIGQLILKEAVNSGYNVWRDSLIYLENGLLSIYLAEDWQDDQWVNDWRELYKYNVDYQPTEIVREIWFDEEWVTDSREVYSYDNSGNLTMIQYQLWTTDDVWEDYERVQYKYSENNYVVHGKYELLFGENWVAENGSLEFYDYYENHFYFGRQTDITVHYDGVTNVDYNELVDSREFQLSQNYPNPFNPSTTIRYSIPVNGLLDESKTVLKIYDVLGKEIKTLVNEIQLPGNYELNWNASDLPSGVYFYELRAGTFAESKKMLLLK